MKKIQKELLVIYSLKAQNMSNKEIVRRFNISDKTVGKIANYTVKKISDKTAKKIDMQMKKYVKSKSKKTMGFVAQIDYTLPFLQKKKTYRELQRYIKKLQKSESVIKTLTQDKTKADKRRKEGGKAYKTDLKNYYTALNRGELKLRVL